MIKLLILVAIHGGRFACPKRCRTNIEHSVEAYVADWKVALTMIKSILNGKPLLPERQAGEQRRLDATVVERRKNLSGNARSDREVRKGSLTGS